MAVVTDKPRTDDGKAEEIGTGTVRWFGDAPFAPICDETPQVARPVGELCLHCGEPIESTDIGMMLSGSTEPIHQECFMRMIVGSVAHQQRRCSCFGGNGEDDPTISKHEAAKRAAAHFRAPFPEVRVQ